jgi:hypothetical protein
MVKIITLDKKKEDWYKAIVINEAGATIKDVSINKVGKKGDVFPNFDTLAEGQMVEGVLWQSEKGSWYLFPPKEKKDGVSKSAYMEKVMDKKQDGIKESQEHRDNSVRTSATARDATLIVTTFYGGHKLTDEQIKDKWLKWRRWLWFAFDEEIKTFPPFESIEPQVTSDGTIMPFSDDLPPDDVYEQM